MDSLCFYFSMFVKKQTKNEPGVPLLFVFVLYSQQIRFFCLLSLATGFPRHRWWQITRNDIWNLGFTFSFDHFHSFIKVLMMAKAAIYQKVLLVSACDFFFFSSVSFGSRPIHHSSDSSLFQCFLKPSWLTISLRRFTLWNSMHLMHK